MGPHYTETRGFQKDRADFFRHLDRIGEALERIGDALEQRNSDTKDEAFRDALELIQTAILGDHEPLTTLSDEEWIANEKKKR